MARLRLPLLPWWLRWAGVAVVAGLIFYLSILTAPPSDPIAPKPDLVPLDKWRHFLAYGAFAGSLWYATVDWEGAVWKIAALVLGLTIVYGVGLEFWQSMIPERYFSVGDAYANALGSLFAVPLLVVRSWLETVDVSELVLGT